MNKMIGRLEDWKIWRFGDLPIGRREIGWSIVDCRLSMFDWNLESGIWNLEFGIWNLESGIWNLESGIWNHASMPARIITNEYLKVM